MSSFSKSKVPPLPSKIEKDLDEEFVELLTFIQEEYDSFNKHTQIRIEKWVEKLVQCDENLVWKKSRNNYIKILAEMMEVGWVGAMFSKMPPESSISNLSDNEYKRLIEQIHSHRKSSRVFEIKNSHLVSMKQISEPEGDFASEIVSPNCQTDREVLGTKQTNTRYEKKNEIEYLISPKAMESKVNSNQILKRVYELLNRYPEKLENDSEYEEIKSKIKQICGSNEENEISGQLRVEEGIPDNRINLFQFGSPRGHTQMQYFKAALQL